MIHELLELTSNTRPPPILTKNPNSHHHHHHHNTTSPTSDSPPATPSSAHPHPHTSEHHSLSHSQSQSPSPSPTLSRNLRDDSEDHPNEYSEEKTDMIGTRHTGAHILSQEEEEEHENEIENHAQLGFSDTDEFLDEDPNNQKNSNIQSLQSSFDDHIANLPVLKSTQPSNINTNTTTNVAKPTTTTSAATNKPKIGTAKFMSSDEDEEEDEYEEQKKPAFLPAKTVPAASGAMTNRGGATTTAASALATATRGQSQSHIPGSGAYHTGLETGQANLKATASKFSNKATTQANNTVNNTLTQANNKATAFTKPLARTVPTTNNIPMDLSQSVESFGDDSFSDDKRAITPYNNNNDDTPTTSAGPSRLNTGNSSHHLSRPSTSGSSTVSQSADFDASGSFYTNEVKIDNEDLEDVEEIAM